MFQRFVPSMPAMLVVSSLAAPSIALAHADPHVTETRDHVSFAPNSQGGVTVTDERAQKTTTYGWEKEGTHKKECAAGQQAEIRIYHAKPSLACTGTNIPGTLNFTVNAFQHSFLIGGDSTFGKIGSPPSTLTITGQQFRDASLVMYASGQGYGITVLPGRKAQDNSALLLNLKL